MKTSSSITRNRVFGYMILTMILFRVVTGTFGLQFYSIYAEEIYWAITSLIGAVWLISSQKKQGVIAALIGAFAVFYCFLFVFCMYFTWLLIGAVDEVKPETFKGIDKKVWLEFHQGSWGGTPYGTLGIGSSYFGGLMHREDQYLTVDFVDETAPWSEADNFEIPDSVIISDCILWKQKNLLFDMENKVCYKLKYKQKLPLSDQEQQCKSDFEKKWNASLKIEKGMSSYEPLYAQSKTVYVQVNFNDPKKAISLSNVDAEEMTAEFCREYVTKLNPAHPFDSIMVFFKCHDRREIYESNFRSKDKYARFSIRNNVVIPCKPGSDFIKKQVIPWSPFLVITHEKGGNDSQKPWQQKLGYEIWHLKDDFKLFRGKNSTYKGLNCEVYEAKHPDKLQTPNGYLNCEVTYYMYNGELIKSEVKYLCYPTNNRFKYREVVHKIAGQRNKQKEVPAYCRFVSTEYLDFYNNNGDNTEISCHADTTKVPWQIESTTTIINPEFVYLYRENL